MDSIIEINNLKKYFGDIRAVDDISFSVERGSLFAFLGVNGAGKSTTINMLCTLLRKDGGSVTIDAHNLDEDDFAIKNVIGIVFQGSVLDERLSVQDNLKVRASFYGLRGRAWTQRLAELTEMLSMQDLLKRPFGKLSGGQKRKVDIARGLIHSPKILFLDEPTTGLDPATRRTIWDIIHNIRKERNMTVFLTTHYMEEAEKANRVVIIDGGKIIADDTPNNLKVRFSGDYIKLYGELGTNLEALLISQNYEYRYENGAYLVKVDSSAQALEFLAKHGNSIDEFEVVKGNMDDVFLNATGKKLEV